MPSPTTTTLRVHATLNSSRANGPGVRAVLWVQGCDLGCPGCYNPDTHEGGGEQKTIDELIDWLGSCREAIEGLSISGGEPLQQAAGVLELVERVRQNVPELSILLFSGYGRKEIDRMPHGPSILKSIDVLIDGRYVAKLHRGRSLRGSENQHIHCLTDRYSVEGVAATPATEVTIAADGSLILTGVSPLDVEC